MTTPNFTNNPCLHAEKRMFLGYPHHLRNFPGIF